MVGGMTRAADILRERAKKSEDIILAYGVMYPDELRAVADLMDDSTTSDGYCRFCGARLDHFQGCKLAALERAITGESE